MSKQTNLCAQEHKDNNLFINSTLTQAFYKLLHQNVKLLDVTKLSKTRFCFDPVFTYLTNV